MEPLKKRMPTSRHWVFTSHAEPLWNAPSELPPRVRYVVWQHEAASTTGKLHVQGYAEFSESVRYTAARTMLQLPDDTHFEVRKGTREQARDYCRKEETRVDGPWELGTWTEKKCGVKQVFGCTPEDFLEYVDDPEHIADLSIDRDVLIHRFPSIFARAPNLFAYGLDRMLNARIPTVDIQLYDWQIGLLRHLRAPPQTRRIFWIWSRASATGKSTFVQYLARVEFRGRVLIPRWSLRDLLYAYDRHWIIAFNMPRDAQEEFLQDRTYLTTLERISDGGIQMSDKYNSCQKFIDAHVIVTANVPPLYEKLPKRIVEICLDPGSPLRPYHNDAYDGPMPIVDDEPVEEVTLDDDFDSTVVPVGSCSVSEQ